MTMNFTLHVWRQKDQNSPGRMEAIPAKGISPDMSFLEMLDIVNDGRPSLSITIAARASAGHAA